MLISSLLFTIFLHITASQRVIPAKDLNNITVTFGSCNKYTGDDNNHIFYRIAETDPDVWIWLGDVEYVDHRVMPMFFIYAGDTKVKKKFIDAKNSISYTHLRSKTEVIGVWDDHDYGLNNGGKYFKHKATTKQLWLDYIDEPLESPRRKREGIYESYYIGDPTKIKVILLDVRYCKDEHSVFGGGDMLGEDQWNWFEEQLKDNKAALTLIGSGTQILPDDRFFTETWYDESRQKLLDLLKKYKVKGVVLLSGDVHYAEIMKYPCRDRLGFDLYEFTSSGLTHRAGETVPASDKIITAVYPDTYNTNEDRYYERNFGIIRLSFDKDEKPVVRFEVRNYYGIEVLSEDIDYPKISFEEAILNNQTLCELDVSVAGRLIEKSVESLLEGDFYPLLVIVVLTYTMVTAVLFALALKKGFYLICGLAAKNQQKQKKE